DLKHSRNLECLCLADQVRYSWSNYENLQRANAALDIGSPEQVLCNYALQGLRECVSDLVLLCCRKDVNDAVDCLCGAWRVQCAENEVACCGCRQCKLDSFEIPHFTDEDDIRVFAERATKRRRERLRVKSNFAMIDQTGLAFVHEFNRIFDGNDVVSPSLVRMIDDCGKGRGFSAACRTSYQHQAFI